MLTVNPFQLSTDLEFLLLAIRILVGRNSEEEVIILGKQRS